jgi:hypothetical protein
MTPFQPPADYTRREVEAIKGNGGCAFYGTMLVNYEGGEWRGFRQKLIQAGSSRCALVTSGHSPCWMEVEESRAPDWPQCPLNPEYAAANIWRPALNVDEEERQEAATIRIVAALKHLNRNIRKMADVPAGDVPR